MLLTNLHPRNPSHLLQPLPYVLIGALNPTDLVLAEGQEVLAKLVWRGCVTS